MTLLTAVFTAPGSTVPNLIASTRNDEARQAIDLTGFSWVRGQDLNL